jgi:Protein phosphatase 2C
MNLDTPGHEPPGNWEWAVCGASVSGSEHLRRGLSCDDAYSYGVAGDFVVAAVADGAGSVTGTSALGSYAACQSVLADAMTPRFIDDHRAASATERKDMLRWLFERALEHVRLEADALGMDLALLATTLCVAIVDRRAATFGQIGDGIIGAEFDDQINTLLTETKDEYANATWFIQSDGAFDVAYRSVSLSGLTAFALSTDGMSYKITNVATGEAYAPFFRGSWGHVRSGASAANFTAFLRGIEDDQTGDDKTMVLAALRRHEGSSRRDTGILTDSSPPPQHSGATSVAPQHDPPRLKKKPAQPGWVTVMPSGAEGEASTAAEPSTDELPAARRGSRRRGITRRREA